MPERRLFPEFRDQFAQTNYPFEDSALLQPTATTMHGVDKDLFLDASLYPIGAVGGLYINRITIAARYAKIEIADKTQKTKASVEFDPLFPTPVLRLTDTLGRPAGVLVSDAERLGRFSAWGFGAHTYTQLATTFAAACTIPTPEVGVRGIMLESGELFTKDVLIVGDNGVVVREGSTSGAIRVDVVGDPLFLRTLCDPLSLFSTPNFIRTINGCPPDEYGNFNLTIGDHMNEQTILRIYPSTAGLVIAAVGKTTHKGS